MTASPGGTAVVVPVYRGASTLAAAVNALLTQKPFPPDRVILVDDASPDASLAEARALEARFPQQVQVVARPRNGGEAAALNEGFRLAAAADLIGIVEADVVVAPDWLARLKALLERSGPGVWGVGGALKPFPADPWPARLAGYEVQDRQVSQTGEIRHVSSANVLYRRRAWEAAGPFREDLVNASLDSDFNLRLQEKGGRLAWDPDAIAWHHYKPCVSGWMARTFAYARTRCRVSALALYPGDREAAARLPLDLAACSTPLWGWFFPHAAGILIVIALVLRFPDARRVLRERRDLAGVLLPPVLLLRGAVAAAGLALGLLEEPVS